MGGRWLTGNCARSLHPTTRTNEMCRTRNLTQTDKILLDFEIHTYNLFLARRPDIGIVNKKKEKEKRICRIEDFAVPADYRVKLKESEMIEKYLYLARELKNTNGNWKWGWCQLILVRLAQSPRIGTRTWGLRNKRSSGDHPNYRIVEIGHNTKKSPEDRWKIAVT